MAFHGAIDLLDALEGLGHPFSEVGITGYPETHPLIDDAATIAAMSEKARHATYVVSQVCFDSAVTAAWIEDVWARGTRLPIHVGIPGAVPRAKLIRVSSRIGVGDSMRFLRKNARLRGPVAARLRSRRADRRPRRGARGRQGRRVPRLHVQRRRGHRALAPAAASLGSSGSHPRFLTH